MKSCIARFFLAALSIILPLGFIAVSPALAAQRTFVASYGNDGAACSIAAPCRGFAAAIAQADNGGEVIALDSAGYGAFIISRSMSIIAPPGVYAGISVFPGSPGIGSGITINAGKVILRGLTINGQGGNVGIHIFQSPVVHIEDCVVSGLVSHGIQISGTIGMPEVFIDGTVVRENGGDGIHITGTAQVNVDRSRVERNAASGIYALNGPTLSVSNSVSAANANRGIWAVTSLDSNNIRLTVSDSTIGRNTGTGIEGSATGSSSVTLRLARNTVTQNDGGGILATGPSFGIVHATVSDSLVTDNLGDSISATGNNVKLMTSNNAVSGSPLAGLRQANSALFQTSKNNVVSLNGNDVVGTMTTLPGE